MMAFGWQVSDTMAFGQIASQGLEPIAAAFVAFGPGLVGYGIAFMLTRSLYSLGDIRTASRLVILGAVAGVVVMQALSWLLDDVYRSAALAAGYGAAQTVTAALLIRRVRALTGALDGSRLLRRLLTAVLSAGVAAMTMMAVADRFGDRRRESGAAILVAGVVGVVVFAVVMLSADRGLRERLVRRFR
jgi:putative peptidoglycan lipid II flippase